MSDVSTVYHCHKKNPSSSKRTKDESRRGISPSPRSQQPRKAEITKRVFKKNPKN